MSTVWGQKGRWRLRPDGILAVVILAIVLLNQVWGEKVEREDGLGWDGIAYARIARDLPSMVRGGLNPYYAQRFLPSAVVHVSLGLCGAEMTTRNIILAFTVLNTACMILSLWVWAQIASDLVLGITGRCLSLLALFTNFFFLKFSAYYPVLTDDAAFLIGLLQFLFYLKDRTWGLLVTSALGAFVWPTALPVGLILAIFPREEGPERATTRTSVRMAVGLSALISVGYVAALAYAAYEWHLRGRVGWIPSIPAEPVLGLLPLAAGIVVTIILAGLIQLLNERRFYSILALLKSVDGRNTLLALGVFLLVKAIQQSLLFPDAAAEHTLGFKITSFAKVASLKPGLSLPGQLAYWGPPFILLILYWKTVARSVQHMGIGMTLVAAAGLLLAVDPEARHVLSIYPMVALVGIKAIESRIPARPLLGFLAPVSFLASLSWFRINTGPFTDNPMAFPDQRLFMSLGPWMTTSSYILRLAAAVSLAGILYVFCFRPARIPGPPHQDGVLRRRGRAARSTHRTGVA